MYAQCYYMFDELSFHPLQSMRYGYHYLQDTGATLSYGKTVLAEYPT